MKSRRNCAASLLLALMTGALDQSDENEFAGAVDRNKEPQLSFVSLQREPSGRESIATLSCYFRLRLRCFDGWRGGDHHWA